jgi:predicted phosphoribosyltransferase
MTRLPFRDRREAGRLLAAKLAPYANRPDVLVLALLRGGVPVAYKGSARRRCFRTFLGISSTATPRQSSFCQASSAARRRMSSMSCSSFCHPS